MRICGIRHWIEQSYKQVKDELGRADRQVRFDIAIRRHQALVNCAFSFYWDAWFGHSDPPLSAAGGERGACTRRSAQPPPSWPRALRAVRAWLAPSIALRRWWAAWSNAPHPRSCKP